MAKRTVVIDLFTYQLPIEGTNPPRFSHHRAFRGQEIDIPADVVARGEELGALTTAEEAPAAMDAIDRDSGPIEGTPEGDAELATWSPAELIAYVTQNPGEAARVFALEQARTGKSRPRVTVIRAAGYDPATGEPVAEPATFDDTPPPGEEPTAPNPVAAAVGADS